MHKSGYFAQGSSPQAHPDEESATVKPRAFVVGLKSGEVTSIPVPPPGTETVGLDAQGEVIALALQTLTDNEQELKAVKLDGEEIQVEDTGDGLPALAHAYRLEGGASWKRVETKSTSTASDLSLGITVLDRAKALGPESKEQLQSLFQGDTVEDEALLAKLRPLAPPQEGGWIFGGSQHGQFYYFEVTGDLPHSTGLVAIRQGEQVVKAPELGFTDGDLVALRVSGAYLLVTDQHTGAFPRLYDLRTAKPVFKSETARATTLWHPGAVR